MSEQRVPPPDRVHHHSDAIKAEHELLGVTDETVRRFDAWAADKATKSNGRFINFQLGDPNYPPKINRYHEGNPLDHTLVDLFAAEASPHYGFIRGRIAQLEAEQQLISNITAHGASGDNYFFVFPHDDLIDLALGLGAIYSQMDKQGKPSNIETAIIINAMIERLGINVNGDAMPTIDALKIGANHIWQSAPKTKSARRHMGKDAGDEYYGDEHSRVKRAMLERGVTQKMDFHNYRLRKKFIAPALSRDDVGVIGSVAAPGSEVVRDEEDPTQLLIQRTNSRTGEMLMDGRTYVIGVATSYTREWEPFFELATPPTRLQAPEQIHDVMDAITLKMNEHTPADITYSYESAEQQAA